MADAATLVIRTVTGQVKDATRDLADLERQAARTERETGELGRTSSDANRQVGLLGVALRSAAAAAAAYGAVRLAGEVVQMADAFKLAQNQLRLTVDSSQELVRVQEDVFQVAQQTRTAYQSTVQLYARVARSADELGVSQDRLLGVTRTINQAIQVSGATSVEASAGVIQLAQALASGALRGDELRSVMEQMPRLAQAIADGLGVTIGQLRLMGEEGELTAERVIRALESQGDVIDREFGQLAPTIGNSLTVLGNSLINLVGTIDNATSGSTALAAAIISIAEAVDSLSSVDLPDWVTFLLDFGEKGVGQTLAREAERLGERLGLNAPEPRLPTAAEARARSRADIEQPPSQAPTQLRDLAFKIEAEGKALQGQRLGALAARIETEDETASRNASNAAREAAVASRRALAERERENERRQEFIATTLEEANQERRLSEAKLRSAQAYRSMQIEIDTENALREAGVSLMSEEGTQLALAIRQRHEAAAAVEDHTASLARNRRRLEEMLRGPTGRASFVRPDEQPAEVTQSQQDAGREKAAWDVATNAVIGHFETIDEAGVAVGRGLTDVTTQVLLYGESWQSVAQGVLRSLAEVLIQIGITTAAVAGLRTIMGVPGGFSGALNTVLGIPFAAGATGGATGFAGTPAGGAAGATALVGGVPQFSTEGGLVGSMFGQQASTQMASQATGTGAAGAGGMGMVGMFLGAGVAGALGGALLANATGGSAGGGALGGAIGGVAGFALGGPFGAVLGAGLGGALGGQLFGQHGFDVRVPGSGGGDTVPFFAMVQPGERVTATPPGKQAAGGDHFTYAPSIDARGADAQAVRLLLERERLARLDFERRISTRFGRDPGFRRASRLGAR